MFYALLLLLLIAGVVIAVTFIVEWGKSSRDANKARARRAERTLNQAERTLRNIANGSGNSVLEAQIALDEINNYHEKELT